MTYLEEFRRHWRSLAAASLGLGAGYSIINYCGNLFTPKLIAEFGWSKSELALVGVTAMLGVLCQPIAGRLTDAFGVRRMAAAGVVAAPLVFLGMSAMSGAIAQYFLLYLVNVVIVGGTTSATTYSRLIVQHFQRARGSALAIAASAPAALGALAVPFLAVLIDSHGWRAGYIALAAVVAVVGVTALLLIPAGNAPRRERSAAKARDPAHSYRVILRNPAFGLIIAGMLLCNVAFVLQTSQLKVVLLDHGVDSDTGSLAASLFAAGVVVGRLLCGAALDRFPAWAVAAISMGLPSIGMVLLAAGVSAPVLVAATAVLLGLGLGAEADIMGYLIMKYFRLEVYSSVLGLVLGTVALSITLGSLLLSYTLKQSGGSFTPFLIFSAASIFIGASLFLWLGRIRTVEAAAAPAPSH